MRLDRVFADRRQRDPLIVGQFQSSFDLATQNAVLGDEVFDLESEFVIDSARYLRKQFLPAHLTSGGIGRY